MPANLKQARTVGLNSSITIWKTDTENYYLSLAKGSCWVIELSSSQDCKESSENLVERTNRELPSNHGFGVMKENRPWAFHIILFILHFLALVVVWFSLCWLHNKTLNKPHPT